MNILIAPNAFKNSLDANKAANAIKKGLQQGKLVCDIKTFPVGDGGDGTAHLLIQHLNGKKINTSAHDPLGRKINTAFGLIDNYPANGLSTAVIGLADASGLRLLHKKEYDPLNTTTYGTGELIKHAMDKKVKKIILCVGGSATVDGGSGLLQTLGVKFLDSKNKELNQLPGALTRLTEINTTNIDKRLFDIEFIVLCDVENKLLGANGAASVFGPQKGASKKQVRQLESCLTRFRDIALKKTGKDMALIKHGGAAGGVSAGLHTFLNAKLVNGIEYFLDATNFDKALQQTDLVITGEGSIDAQTLQGKGPYGVAKRAKERSIPVIGLGGHVPLRPNKRLDKFFDLLLSINNQETDLHTAIQNTYENLIRTSKLFGNLLYIAAK